MDLREGPDVREGLKIERHIGKMMIELLLQETAILAFYVIIVLGLMRLSYNQGYRSGNDYQSVKIKTKTEMVREFTEGAFGPMPDRWRVMSNKDIIHIVNMVLSELTEILQTLNTKDMDSFVADGKVETVKLLAYLAERVPTPKLKTLKSDLDIAAEQIDGFVDIVYYLYDMAVRNGFDLDICFDAVHESNMRKGVMVNGVRQFIIVNNKITKPEGWVDNDMTKVLNP